MQEDVEVFEAQQRSLELKLDAAPIAARRIIERLVRAEKADGIRSLVRTECQDAGAERRLNRSNPAGSQASGGAKIVNANRASSPVRSVCGAPAGIVTRSPALISHSLPETRAVALPSIT